MKKNRFPDKDKIKIQFSHVAYRMAERFSMRDTGIYHYQTWTEEETLLKISQCDVLVISGFWNNALLEDAKNLKYVQSIGAGYDQFPLEELKMRGIRLVNAKGVNTNAVAEHALSLMLALTRQVHISRDNQINSFWRGMLCDISLREDELLEKTVLIVGMGNIGSRLAKFAKALDMRVLGVKRDTLHVNGPVDEIYSPDELLNVIGEADYVVLTCPLTPETENIVDKDFINQMKQSAYFINVARGGCVDEQSLINALNSKKIAGAAIDHFKDEPLKKTSFFWKIPNLIITPHTAGETRLYEERVIDITLENLGRLWRNETDLIHQIV